MSRLAFGRARRASAALAVAVLACGLLWIAEPAQAHDQLIESRPSDGENLPAQPEEVVLQFSDELIELGGIVLVTDASGQSWTAGDLVYDGSRARIAVQDGMPDGWYEIRWQVVSGDGHPISGTISFAIGDAGDRPSATPSPTMPGTGVSDGQDAAGTGGSAGPGVTRIVLVGLAGAAVAVGGFWLVSRLLRRRDTHHGTDEPDSP